MKTMTGNPPGGGLTVSSGAKTFKYRQSSSTGSGPLSVLQSNDRESRQGVMVNPSKPREECADKPSKSIGILHACRAVGGGVADAAPALGRLRGSEAQVAERGSSEWNTLEKTIRQTGERKVPQDSRGKQRGKVPDSFARQACGGWYRPLRACSV